VKTALVLGLLLAACAAAYAGDVPRPQPCVVLSTLAHADSLTLVTFVGPCGAPPESSIVWRIPSQLERCDLRLLADGTTGQMAVRWVDCLPHPRRSEP